MLREWMSQAELSQTEASALLGVKLSVFKNWLGDRNAPSKMARENILSHSGAAKDPRLRAIQEALLRQSAGNKKASNEAEPKPEEHSKPSQAQSSFHEEQNLQTGHSGFPSEDEMLDKLAAFMGASQEEIIRPARYNIPGFRENEAARRTAEHQERLRNDTEQQKLRTRLIRQLKISGQFHAFAAKLLEGQSTPDISPGAKFINRADLAALERGFQQAVQLLPNMADFLDMDFASVQRLQDEIEFELRSIG
ncbi:MAG: hypothetical protein U0931_04970 [Vulcanimicrobiota bacterium]